MALTKEDIIEGIGALTVIELKELLDAFEEKFGVTAAAPAAVVVAGGGAAGGAAAEDEKDEFDVILVDGGAQKIGVIKAVREITSLGLKEAKGLVDAAPKPLKEGIAKAEGEKIAAMLAVKEFAENRFVMMGTRKGVVKKTELKAYNTPLKADGIIAIKMREGDELIGVRHSSGDNDLLMKGGDLGGEFGCNRGGHETPILLADSPVLLRVQFCCKA